jgi:hypothetical protein
MRWWVQFESGADKDCSFLSCLGWFFWFSVKPQDTNFPGNFSCIFAYLDQYLFINCCSIHENTQHSGKLFSTHTTALSRHLFKIFSIFLVDINFQYFFKLSRKICKNYCLYNKLRSDVSFHKERNENCGWNCSCVTSMTCGKFAGKLMKI